MREGCEYVFVGWCVSFGQLCVGQLGPGTKPMSVRSTLGAHLNPPFANIENLKSESREPKAESREPIAGSREPGAESREPRAEGL